MNEFLKMYLNTLLAFFFLYLGINLFKMYFTPSESTQNRVLFLVFGVFFFLFYVMQSLRAQGEHLKSIKK